MDFKHIYAVVADDFEATNRFIRASLDSNVPLVREVGEYIVSAGGKRLRPLMVLLSARALGYSDARHVDAAAVIELLHTATLLHDDVVDESALRRGRPTVNAVWGNAASVLVGDFLISRAFQLAVAIGNTHLLEILSFGTNLISEGEVWQLLNCHDPNTTEEHYLRVIHHKTAKMFEVAAQSGAALVVAKQPELAHLETAMATYGMHMGMAFQLIDDVLDYQGDAATLGKNVGDDLAEGKPTLPLIYAMQHASAAESDRIRVAIRHGGIEHLQEIVALVQASGGLQYTLEKAREETRKALACLEPLPPTRYRQALADLATEAVTRHF